MMYYNSILKACILLFGTIVSRADKTQNIYYTAVGPRSYICLCVQSYIIKRDTGENLTDWDGECSNNQVCFWNEETILVKHWYAPNN